MKKTMLKKLCSLSLSALMLGGTAITALPVAAYSNITVRDGISHYETEDGFTYCENEDGTITITAASRTAEEIVFPAEIDGKKVSAIGGFVTSGNYQSNYVLKKVVISEGITRIEGMAFMECEALTSISVPKSVVSIGSYAFGGEGKPWYESLPDGVIYFGSVCYGCKGELADNTSLRIKDGTVSVSPYAFSGQLGITGVTIPNSVKEIGYGAFSECFNLKKAVLPEQLTLIEDYLFGNCCSLESITIPKTVTRIGSNAFSNCTAFNKVTLPDSVTSLGSDAFDNTAWYNAQPNGDVYLGKFYYGYKGTMPVNHTVTIKSGTRYIADSAFLQQDNLTGISLPDTLVSVGSNTFVYCYHLKSVSLPTSVKRIGSNAFYGCFIEKLTLSASVKTIEGGAFNSCILLQSVTIPYGVTELQRYAFGNCAELSSVTIPTSVTKMADDVFKDSPKVTIRGKKGSYAETYAKEHNIPFKAVKLSVANKAKLSADTVTLGKSVTVNCVASEGTSPYTYAVYYRKASSIKWTTAQDFDTNTKVTITPKAAVPYEVRVTVKDASGKVSKKDMVLNVTKPLTNTSVLGADAIKLGSKVKVRCFAEGGSGEYQYAVYYKKASSSAWTKLRGYATGNIIMLTPKAATTYDVRVDVKDSTGKVVSKTLTLKVTK